MCNESTIGRLRKVLQSFTTLALLGLVPFFTGCVHFAKPVESSATSSAKTAIVYGRFDGKYPHDFDRDRGGLRLLDLETKRKYYISFRSTNCVYGIAIPPGRYCIDGCTGTIFHFQKGPELSFLDMPDIHCRPNSVTYIGDFKCDLRHLASGGDEWGVYGFTNNYAQTTKEFQADHQDFPPTAFASATEVVEALEKNPKLYEPKFIFTADTNDNSNGWYDYYTPVTCDHHH